jgi:hypothetical protein
MITPTAKKWFGAVVAAVALTMVTSVSPAHASGSHSTAGKTVTVAKRDSGWGLP